MNCTCEWHHKSGRSVGDGIADAASTIAVAIIVVAVVVATTVVVLTL